MQYFHDQMRSIEEARNSPLKGLYESVKDKTYISVSSFSER